LETLVFTPAVQRKQQHSSRVTLLVILFLIGQEPDLPCFSPCSLVIEPNSLNPASWLWNRFYNFWSIDRVWDDVVMLPAQVTLACDLKAGCQHISNVSFSKRKFEKVAISEI
jgi:hypothetical protein